MVTISKWVQYPELIDKLKVMLTQNLSFARIATELGHGLSRNSVIGKATREGLHHPDKAPKDTGLAQKVNHKRNRRRVHITASAGHEISVVLEKLEYITPPEDFAIPKAQRKTLLQLTETTCRFPVGEPNEPDFFFCGADVIANSPYCTHHKQRCTEPRRARPSHEFIKPQF